MRLFRHNWLFAVLAVVAVAFVGVVDVVDAQPNRGQGNWQMDKGGEYEHGTILWSSAGGGRTLDTLVFGGAVDTTITKISLEGVRILSVQWSSDNLTGSSSNDFTITPEVSVDGTNWDPLVGPVFSVSASGDNDDVQVYVSDRRDSLSSNDIGPSQQRITGARFIRWATSSVGLMVADSTALSGHYYLVRESR